MNAYLYDDDYIGHRDEWATCSEVASDRTEHSKQENTDERKDEKSFVQTTLSRVITFLKPVVEREQLTCWTPHLWLLQINYWVRVRAILPVCYSL